MRMTTRAKITLSAARHLSTLVRVFCGNTHHQSWSGAALCDASFSPHRPDRVMLNVRVSHFKLPFVNADTGTSFADQIFTTLGHFLSSSNSLYFPNTV